MIVECPECKTSHSKTEAELANGAPVACRRCSKAFRLAAGGGTELVPGGAAVAAAGGVSTTSVMDVASIKKSLGAMRGPDIGLELEDGMAAKPMAVPAPKPAAAASSASSNDLFAGLGLDLQPPKAKDAPTRVDHPKARMVSGGAGVPASGLELAAPAAAKDATVVKGPRPTGPTQLGSDFGTDVPTDMIKPAALKEKLAEMKKANIEAVPAGLSEQRSAPKPPRPSSPFGPPAFPQQTLERLGTELVEWAKNLPMPRRTGLAAGAALVVILLVVVMVSALREGREIFYVRDTQPLWGGPLAGEVYPQLATLERGAEVVVHGEAGEFALVSDAMGRAGYLRSEALLDEQPAAAPEMPFADCARAPIELSIERCQGRAQEQFDSCRDVCSSKADESSCLEHCQERFGDCMRACEGEAEHPKEPRAAELPAAASDEVKKKTPKKPQAPKKKKR